MNQGDNDGLGVGLMIAIALAIILALSTQVITFDRKSDTMIIGVRK